MDVVAAYRDVGTYRGAAEMCGVDPKTVKRKVLAHEVGELEVERAVRAAVPRNTDVVRQLVERRVAETKAKISAKRLLPAARAAGYAGSARNFRRLVAEAKKAWRVAHGRQRRPAVWVPGETLVIDWGTLPNGVKVCCAVRSAAWQKSGRTAAGMSMLPKEIAEIINDLLPAHDDADVARAVARATRFGRFRAVDVRSILAIGPAAPEPAGNAGHRRRPCGCSSTWRSPLVTNRTAAAG